MGDLIAPEGQVARLKHQSFREWKHLQAKRFQEHLTDEERSQGAEVRLIRFTALRSIDQTKVRQVGELTAEREGLVNRYAVLVCLPGTFKQRGGEKPNSGRKVSTGQSYRNKYQTKLPEAVYQQAVGLCDANGGPTSHTERVRYFILQGVTACQSQHPVSRIDFGRAPKLLPGTENIRFTDQQASAIEGCRQPGETAYRLIQRLFQIGVRYASEVVFPLKPTS